MKLSELFESESASEFARNLNKELVNWWGKKLEVQAIHPDFEGDENLNFRRVSLGHLMELVVDVNDDLSVDATLTVTYTDNRISGGPRWPLPSNMISNPLVIHRKFKSDTVQRMEQAITDWAIVSMGNGRDTDYVSREYPVGTDIYDRLSSTFRSLPMEAAGATDCVLREHGDES